MTWTILVWSLVVIMSTRQMRIVTAEAIMPKRASAKSFVFEPASTGRMVAMRRMTAAKKQPKSRAADVRSVNLAGGGGKLGLNAFHNVAESSE